MPAMTRFPRFLLIACTTLAAANAPASPGAGEPPGSRTAITVTYPNGGEVVEAGSVCQIQWAGYSYGVDIILLKDDVPYYTIGQASGTYFDWQICEQAVPGAQYKVRVTAVGDPAESDESDAPFEISGPARPALSLTAPNGGESWPAGSHQIVTWNASNPTGHVGVWLHKDGAVHSFLGACPMEVGALAWDLCPGGFDEGEYTIRIAWLETCMEPVEDLSDAPFSITAPANPPQITVTSPNGGEVWYADQTYNITWTTNDPTGLVEIWSVRADEDFDLIDTVPAAAGSYTWQVPPCTLDSPYYKILAVRSLAGCDIEDSSDGEFEISGSADPVLNVVSPAAGASWTAGSTQTLAWTCDKLNGHVHLDLWKSGRHYAHLGQVPVSDGLFSWDICPGIGDGGSYSVHLTFAECAVRAESGQFSIIGSVTPTLELMRPGLGESWLTGTVETVEWNATGLAGDVIVRVPSGGDQAWWFTAVPVWDSPFYWPIAPTIADGSGRFIEIISYDCGPLLTDSTSSFSISASPDPGLGDVDADGDVDLRDFAALQACFAGDGIIYNNPVCGYFDIEPDRDLDLADFAVVHAILTGPAATGENP
ncbi:MAG: hypothetical protein JXB13_05230 [Phycisphaerae bacterium]|nr:hypothetical protein [Phycisphaerae bacterium]